MINKIFIILISKVFLIFSSIAYCQDIIDDASNYTVRFRVLVDNPFIEDTNDDEIIRSWVGAGFVIDKSSGIIVTNAHVSGVGNTFIKIAFKGERFIKSEFTLITKAYLLPEDTNSVVTNKISNIQIRKFSIGVK